MLTFIYTISINAVFSDFFKETWVCTNFFLCTPPMKKIALRCAQTF